MSIRQVLGSLNLGSIRGFLMSLYHGEGAGRKPYPPVSMLKTQLLKHLRRIPSDRRLALLLKRNDCIGGPYEETLVTIVLKITPLLDGDDTV